MIWHAIATYKEGADENVALVLDVAGQQKLYDLQLVFRTAHPDEALPVWAAGDTRSLLADWGRCEPALADLAGRAAELAATGNLSELVDGAAKLAAPIVPDRIFAAASNYVEHANEMGTVLAAKANSNPYMFVKVSTCVIGPGQTVRIPPETNEPDWEVELAAVIGRSGRRVSVEDALDYVAGYTIVNDVTARDLNKRTDFPFKFDWFQGKNFDTFAPIGPWIVPRSCIEDPQSLAITLSVNDEMMQNSTTAEMIFNVREQISYLSKLVTLQPGDVIATGTPTGVGAGRGIFLKAGDVMRASVQDIGTLENPVDAE